MDNIHYTTIREDDLRALSNKKNTRKGTKKTAGLEAVYANPCNYITTRPTEEYASTIACHASKTTRKCKEHYATLRLSKMGSSKYTLPRSKELESENSEDTKSAETKKWSKARKALYFTTATAVALCLLFLLISLAILAVITLQQVSQMKEYLNNTNSAQIQGIKEMVISTTNNINRELAKIQKMMTNINATCRRRHGVLD